MNEKIKKIKDKILKANLRVECELMSSESGCVHQKRRAGIMKDEKL